jgi:hypothetical protein
MAFTDPILSGEELIRSGIKSQNYVKGSAGWRIGADGSAEFNTMSIRGEISATDVILGGKSLNATLASKSQGVLAWVTGYPVVSTTGEAQIGFIELDVVAGRMYEIFATNISVDIGNPTSSELRVRYTLATNTYPDNNSPIMVLSLRFSQFTLALVRHLYLAPTTGRLRLRLTLASLDGGNCRTWAPGTGMSFGVIDQGIPAASAGIIGSGPATVTLKEYIITANQGNGYKGDGSFLIPDLLVQGVQSLGIGSSGYGNTRSWFTFAGSDIATVLDNMIGVPLANVVTCELFLYYEDWYNAGGGFATVGYHNKTSLGGTGPEPSGGVPNALQWNYTARNQGRWIDLKSNTSIMDAFRSGYLRGFMLGNGPTGTNYAGYAQAPGDVNPPQLHVKYYG